MRWSSLLWCDFIFLNLLKECIVMNDNEKAVVFLSLTWSLWWPLLTCITCFGSLGSPIWFPPIRSWPWVTWRWPWSSPLRRWSRCSRSSSSASVPRPHSSTSSSWTSWARWSSPDVWVSASVLHNTMLSQINDLSNDKACWIYVVSMKNKITNV